jgi:hypothetical protein
LFDGNKAIGSLQAYDGHHGIHIADGVLIGKSCEVPNEHSIAILKFTSPKSIDTMIELLWKAKKYFEENAIGEARAEVATPPHDQTL